MDEIYVECEAFCIPIEGFSEFQIQILRNVMELE